MDGDNAAAMRYTEAKMTQYGQELLKDINKDTIDFDLNFDGTEKEPTVLPGLIPNILANGSTGIAVGIATGIPPHNLTELYDALIYILDKTVIGEEVSLEDIMKIIKGPDFPTGGTIINRSALKKIYETGRGSVVIRSKYKIDKNKLIFTEIPYQKNKSNLVTKIDLLRKTKVIPEIQAVRDESNKEGIAIVIELNKDANIELVLNNLFKKTELQSSFTCNMNALDENKIPKLYGLKDMLDSFLVHAANIVIRRTQFELKKYEARKHIIDGMLFATDENNIEKIIETMRHSSDPLKSFIEIGLSEIQAKHIMGMRFDRLSKTSQKSILKESNDIEESIKAANIILDSDESLLLQLKKEFVELKEKLGDERLTEITSIESNIEDEDLIPDEDLVILFTADDCIKSVSLEEYKTQNRGGKGVKAGSDQNEYIKNIINANNKDHLLFFTNKGRCIILKAYKIQKSSRTSRAKSMLNYINLNEDENVISIINIDDKEKDKFLFFITKKGIVKKLSVEQLSNSHSSTRVMTFRDEDVLVQVLMGSNDDDVILITKKGLGLRTSIKNIRAMGRTAMGVKGITLKDGDEVIDMALACNSKMLLTITSNGYGKKTNFDEFTAHNRGGKGMISHKITDKTGLIASVCNVEDQNELLIATNTQLVRVRVDSISLMNRGTQGVKLISLNKDDKVASASIIQVEKKEDELAE